MVRCCFTNFGVHESVYYRRQPTAVILSFLFLHNRYKYNAAVCLLSSTTMDFTFFVPLAAAVRTTSKYLIFTFFCKTGSRLLLLCRHVNDAHYPRAHKRASCFCIEVHTSSLIAMRSLGDIGGGIESKIPRRVFRPRNLEQ